MTVPMSDDGIIVATGDYHPLYQEHQDALRPADAVAATLGDLGYDTAEEV